MKWPNNYSDTTEATQRVPNTAFTSNSSTVQIKESQLKTIGKTEKENNSENTPQKEGLSLKQLNLPDEAYNAIYRRLQDTGSNPDTFADLTANVTQLNGAIPPDALVESIHGDFIQKLDMVYASGIACAMPDAEAVFETLRAQNIKTALNTGYSREVALLLMQQLGWSVPQTVDALVTASDVTIGRPHPDMPLDQKQVADFWCDQFELRYPVRHDCKCGNLPSNSDLL